MILERIERMMTVVFPKEKGGKSVKFDQAATDKEDFGPLAIAAALNQKGKPKVVKAKARNKANANERVRANNNGVDTNNAGYGGGGGDRATSPQNIRR